jgi:hypothetical protein
MHRVAKSMIKKPDANTAFRIAHAALLSAKFHSAHDPPKGCRNDEHSDD